jgi:hypothetical protein
MNLTLPNIFSPDFATACQHLAGQLPAVQERIKGSAQRASELQAECDTAYATRDAAKAQCYRTEAALTALKSEFQGPGAMTAFKAILAAETEAERAALADTRAAEGARIRVLEGTVAFHRDYMGPTLDISAARAEVELRRTVFEMHAWNAVQAGIERFNSASEILKTEGVVSFPRGGRTEALVDRAGAAHRALTGAMELLERLERHFKETR